MIIKCNILKIFYSYFLTYKSYFDLFLSKIYSIDPRSLLKLYLEIEATTNVSEVTFTEAFLLSLCNKANSPK